MREIQATVEERKCQLRTLVRVHSLFDRFQTKNGCDVLREIFYVSDHSFHRFCVILCNLVGFDDLLFLQNLGIVFKVFHPQVCEHFLSEICS